MAIERLTRPAPDPLDAPAAAPRPPSPRSPAGDPPWVKWAFGALVAGALLGFVVYPTYPNYDSLYSLLWGREVLDGELPSFTAYRAPTEHPLAIAVGLLLSLLGESADRVWILLSLGSLVALVAGVFRLATDAFTPLVGLVAALLLVTRFDFPFYAARGYIDIAYMALVVWAAVLEARRPRRGVPVLLLLGVAGMLRPEAWVMAGLYFLWVAWRAPWRDRALFAVLAALGPAVWAGTDFVVTGDPLFSLTYTSNFAEELGRSKSSGDLLPAVWAFLVKLDKFPVLLAGLAGLVAAVVLVPRRAVMPGVLLAVGIGTFLLVGLGGFSVIDRYLLVASLMVMVFAAVALAGWTLLRPGRLRRVWAVGAGLLVVYGIIFTATRVNLDQLDSELRFRGDAHASLEAVLSSPRIRDGLACGPVSVPNHKLIPDVRWMLDRGEGGVIARSDPDAAPRADRGVAIYPHGRHALFRHAFVSDTDDPLTQVPPAGWERAVVSQYYTAYVRCP